MKKVSFGSSRGKFHLKMWSPRCDCHHPYPPRPTDTPVLLSPHGTANTSSSPYFLLPMTSDTFNALVEESDLPPILFQVLARHGHFAMKSLTRRGFTGSIFHYTMDD